MEFLRYGSRIPGAYKWGCCAVCIIQNFKEEPDKPASIEVVSGDSGMPIRTGNESAFLGPTHRDIFNQRLRIGTFSGDDMPNHVFLAVLTADQLQTSVGLAWLKIRKEAGFEFIRATDNSVYTGQMLYREVMDMDEETRYEEGIKENSHINYIFGLFRNIGNGRVEDPFQPPKAWTDLSPTFQEVKPVNASQLEQERYEYHLSQWDKIGPVKFMKRDEVIAAGAPVVLAGLFSDYPQETEDARNKKTASKSKAGLSAQAAAPASPW
jgi:hypothetical protein